jgi:hypothetical protein
MASGSQSHAAEPTAPAESGTLQPVVRDPIEARRARGLVFLDLPLGLRARYDAHALLRLPPGANTAPIALYVPSESPQRSTRLIESRFALSRVVGPKLEVELSWAARSPLSMVDLLRVEDQRVTAMIRFVP